MDLIIIIVFVILILSCMITAYVPYELQPLASKAGFSKFSLRFCLLRFQKVPIKYLFEQYVKLTDINIPVEFEDFKQYWSSKPEKLENTIKILLNAKNAGIDIPFNKIDEYNLTEKNSLKFFSVLRKLEKNNLNFSQNEIFALINSDFDIDTYFSTLEKATKFNIDISTINNNEINLEGINIYLNTLQKAKSLKINFNSISEKNISWKAKNTIVSNLIEVNQLNINISEDEIIELYNSGINTNDYIKAIELLQTEKFEGISNEQIKSHFIKGGNSKEVLEALLFAKVNNAKISSSLVFKIDLEKDESIKKLIKKAVIPQEIDVPEGSPIILQDGLQVIPKIQIYAKDNLNVHSAFVDKQNYYNKINNLIYNKILTYKTYNDVLSNIKDITQNTLNELNKYDNNFEKQAFFITNIKIIDIKINTDTLLKIKNAELKGKEKEAKLKLLNAKAKFQDDMSEAIKKGNISFKDYQKEKHIFGSFDNDELPYSD